ncbi:MAG: hypothetical protein ABR518_01535, partial [Actinomycetota bacterium]
AHEAAYARVLKRLMEVMRTAEREADQVRAEAKRDAEAILKEAREQASLISASAKRSAKHAEKSNGKNGRSTDEKTASAPTDKEDWTIDVEMLWGRSEP